MTDIAVVFGTRPEIIKLAPVITGLRGRATTVHTGQHRLAGMADEIRVSVGLSEPDICLDPPAQGRGAQLGAMISALDETFAHLRPRAVIVQGDTTSTLAAALAANARDIAVVHVEAGLRSFDRAMPEEHNRVLVDHLADLCCAPTETNQRNLCAEGISGSRIAVTGNTIVESVLALRPSASVTQARLHALGLRQDEFVLATLHRPENVDSPDTLRSLLTDLRRIRFPVIFPLHPRTERSVETFGLARLLTGLRVIAPLRYPDFLALAGAAAFLVSDSGGLQEEASVLKRPIIVVRRSTDRPEVEGTFATRIPPGPALSPLLHDYSATAPARLAHLATLPSPYGDAHVSTRILAALNTLPTWDSRADRPSRLA